MSGSDSDEDFTKKLKQHRPTNKPARQAEKSDGVSRAAPKSSSKKVVENETKESPKMVPAPEPRASIGDPSFEQQEDPSDAAVAAGVAFHAFKADLATPKQRAEAVQRAQRKIQRAFGKAEELVSSSFDKALELRNPEQSVAVMRCHADEYAKGCMLKRDVAPTATINDRFAQLLTEYRTLLRLETQGVLEHANLVGTSSDSLHREVFARLTEQAVKIDSGEKLPANISQISERTWIDEVFGLVIQKWGGDHQAAKWYVKSMERFANLALNSIFVPMMVLGEVCGVSWTASSLVPLVQVYRFPFELAEVRFAIESATSELQFPLNPVEATQQCIIGRALDGRLYCLHAYGLVPLEYSVPFLNNLDIGATKLDQTRLQALTHGQLDHVAIEAVAMARSGGTDASKQVAKALHRHGLRVQHLNLLHAYLSRQEASREATVGATPDANLSAALAACIAEILARVLKSTLREIWRENVAGMSVSREELGHAMAVYAYQLVSLLVVDGQPSRPTQEHQLYATVAKHGYQFFPKDTKSKARELIWDEQLVSRGAVARRVAHMLGLLFTDNVIIAGERGAVGRLVRGIRLKPRDMWADIHRGKHQDVMKRMVGQIKAARSIGRLHHAYHITLQLADIFHLAYGRLGVNRRPSDLFEHNVWQRRRGSERESTDADAVVARESHVDEAMQSARDIDLLRVLALQGIFHYRSQGEKGDNKDDGGKQGADKTHTEAMQAVQKFVESSIGAVKSFGVERSEEQPVQLIAERCGVLAAAGNYLKGDRMLLGYVEQTLSALDRLRRAKAIDVKPAIHLWHSLFDATVSIQMTLDPRGAVAAAMKKLEFSEQHYGPESAEVATVRNDVGSVLLRLGELNEGRIQFELGFDYLKKMQPTATGTFTTANNLGYTHFRLADRQVDPTVKKKRIGLLKMKIPPRALAELKAAESCFAYVLERREFALPKTLADVLSNQASVFTYRNQFADAMKLYEEALSVSKGLFSDDHPYRANVIRNMRACERRQRANAALWIGCLFRRHRAQRKLGLLKKGSVHGPLLQRVGRGMLDRFRMHRLREAFRVRRIGGGIGIFDEEGIQVEDPLMPRFGEGGRATAIENLRAAPSATSVSPLPLLTDGDSDGVSKTKAIDSGSNVPGTVETFDENGDIIAQDLAAAVILQRIGRGALTRNMLRKLWKFRNRRRR